MDTFWQKLNGWAGINADPARERAWIVKNPKIESTRFGWITIDGVKYTHDVIIRADGCVEKRKKKLSKKLFGTSHIVSEEEARDLYEEGVQMVIVGSGQYGVLKLSDDARKLFRECSLDLLPTPKAAQVWNETSGPAVALFHITC